MAAFAAMVSLVALALASSIAGAASSRPVIAYGSERGGPVLIAILGLNPGKQRVLRASNTGMDVEPSWSPDGNRIAFATSDSSGQDFDIATMSPNGTNRKRITSGAAWDEKPAWSPNGKWIAFSSDRDGNFDIYLVHPNGTGLHSLTSSTCEDTDPSWSPDGSQIAFTSRRGGFPHVWVMKADGTGKHKLLAARGGRRPGHPTARRSPSSETTTATTRSTRSTPRARTSTQLTANTGIADDNPTWSPDSSMVAFSSNRMSDGDIFEMRDDGSDVHVLVSGVWTDDAPAWRR